MARIARVVVEGIRYHVTRFVSDATRSLISVVITGSLAVCCPCGHSIDMH
jgi:hypothetical protein